ncbi:major facilitator superfamily domain-containing protein [Paraphysoderma sedebokerense]|nr:major facilitator superfamily domain-containing protein [Paraphysoderma sedebokerense]
MRATSPTETEPVKLIPSSPPDGGTTAWLTVVSSFLIHFAALGTQYSYGIYQRYYQNVEFKGRATNTEISFVGTISMGVMLFLGTFVGAMADGKMGYQRTAAIGKYFVAGSMLLASICTEVWQLYLTQGLMFGIGSALCFFPAVSIPAQFSKKRAIATGLAVSGSGVGGIVITMMTNVMLYSIGFRWALRVTGVLSFLMLGVSAPFLQTRIPPKKRDKLFDFSIFKNAKFLPLFMASVFAPFGYLIPFVFLPVYCDYVGLSQGVGAYMLSLVNGFSIVGRIVMGLVSDKFGHVNSYIFCLFISGCSMVSIWLFGDSILMLSIFSIVYGIFAGGFISLVPVVSAYLFGIHGIATIVGLLYSASSLGQLAGPPIAGALIDANIPTIFPSGRYSWGIILGGLMMLLGSFSVMYLNSLELN